MVKLLKWKQIGLKIPQNHPNPFKTLDLAKIGNQGLPKIGTTLVEMPQNQFGYGRFQTLFRKFSNREKTLYFSQVPLSVTITQVRQRISEEGFDSSAYSISDLESRHGTVRSIKLYFRDEETKLRFVSKVQT